MRPLKRPPSSVFVYTDPFSQRGTTQPRKRQKVQRLGAEKTVDAVGGDSEKGGYDVWRGRLIQTWGKYCAYCETPIATTGEVEHKIPKSNLDDPNDATNWSNMLLACRRCNGAKSNRLTQESDYIWPDGDADGDYAAFFNPTGEQSSYKYELTANPITIRLVQGKKKANPTIVDANYMNRRLVIVSPADLNTEDEAQNMIDLVRLNATYDEDARTFDLDQSDTDYMVLLRTDAWDYAVDATTRLNTIYANFPDKDNVTHQAMHDIMKRQILTTAIATGFWSVWMTVFYKQIDSGALDLQNIYTDAEAMLNDFFVTGVSNFLLNFPGIDADRIAY